MISTQIWNPEFNLAETGAYSVCSQSLLFKMDFGNPDMLTDKALSDRHTCEVTELGFNWPVIAVNVEISR